MAKGLFMTFTEAQLLSIRDACVADLGNGGRITSWSDSGTSVSKVLTMDTERMLEEATYALRVKFPATYGAIQRHLASDLRTQEFN
jgi:hypothetical protein